jgi:hypothetical protein
MGIFLSLFVSYIDVAKCVVENYRDWLAAEMDVEQRCMRTGQRLFVSRCGIRPHSFKVNPP